MSSENAAPVRADAPSSDQITLWGVNDDASCRCPKGHGCPIKNRGKHPKGAPYEPGDNLGNLTGADHGRIVVDVDVRGGDGYAEFEALAGFVEPETLTVRTASGGAHFYFAHPGVEIGNGKLSKNVDVRGDKQSADGWAYVVAPCSRVVLDDGTVGTHDVVRDAPLAPCPDWLVAALVLRSVHKVESSSPVAPVDETHDAWGLMCQLAEDACKTYEPSKEDGNASAAMMAIVRRLARDLQLPDDKALELLNEHWNPRCTKSDGVTPYPWDDGDILRALDRSRASGPGEGRADELLARAEGRDIAWKMRLHARSPNATPEPPDAVAKVKVGAGFANDGERQKLSKTALTSMLYNCPAWDGVFGYDVLRHKPIAIDPPLEGSLDMQDGREPTDSDLSLIELWFDAHGFLVSKEQIRSALHNVIKMPDRQRNFIAEYLDSLEEATDSHVLDTLATDVLGATEPFANTLLKKTLVGAALRARKPGAPHKGMLVLKGDQFCGKTPFVKILAGDWYHSTGNGNIADRDTILECQGKWLVEVEELSALGKADANALKTAISRGTDVITKKYIADGERYERSFVLVGTTNKDEFLTDETGNGRYYVIEIPRGKKIDLAELESLRDRIWAEADFLARTMPERWNELADDEKADLEESNADYAVVHPWRTAIEKYLANRQELRSLDEVVGHVLGNDMSKATPRAKQDVGAVVRYLGWRDHSRRDENGKKERFWTPKEPKELKPATVTNIADRRTRR